MKKLMSIILILCLLLSVVSSASALNFKRFFENDATFETLEEAHASAVAFLTANGNPAYTYVPDPALDTYPAGTTYVYRSPNMHSGLSAGLRMNTNLLVYTDAAFADKDAAYAYLDGMGLIDIVNEAVGSIVLVTPIDAEKGFGAADQFAYYQLQSAMCNITYGNRTTREYYADNQYFGGLTNRYLIAVDGGATFVNNYIASQLDYVSRLAGMLLVGGSMDRIRDVAGLVPVYLVNASDMTVAKYKEANGTTAYGYDGDKELFYNQALPLQRVISLKTDVVDMKALVKDAYYGMFIKAMRNAVVQAGLHSNNGPYSHYNFNQAPYSLSARNAILNGKTPDGLLVVEHREDRFANIATETGEYVDVWYEVLPEEVVNGTARDKSIPLILANHGGGDDPVQFLDEIGWLNVAGDERIAIIAARHQESYARGVEILPEMVRYMLDTYPALDPERVYVTGYSYGGNQTYKAIREGTRLFAAMVPMGSTSDATEDWYPTDDTLDLPFLLITATYDFAAFNSAEQRINDNFTGVLNKMLTYNDMDTLTFDFAKYPMNGFKADLYDESILNGEYTNRMWFMCNDEDVPMVGASVVDFMPHGLYQEFARVGWDFMKKFSRDQETGEIVYNAYVK